jgi:hypothetical protein
MQLLKTSFAKAAVFLLQGKKWRNLEIKPLGMKAMIEKSIMMTISIGGHLQRKTSKEDRLKQTATATALVRREHPSWVPYDLPF